MLNLRDFKGHLTRLQTINELLASQ